MNKREYLLQGTDLVKTISNVPSTVLGTGNSKMRKNFSFYPLLPPPPQHTPLPPPPGAFSLGDRDLHYFNLMRRVLRHGTNCKGTSGPQWTNEATHGFQGSLLTDGALVEVCKGKLSFNYVFQAKEISKQGMEAGSNLQ